MCRYNIAVVWVSLFTIRVLTRQSTCCQLRAPSRSARALFVVAEVGPAVFYLFKVTFLSCRLPTNAWEVCVQYTCVYVYIYIYIYIYIHTHIYIYIYTHICISIITMKSYMYAYISLSTHKHICICINTYTYLPNISPDQGHCTYLAGRDGAPTTVSFSTRHFGPDSGSVILLLWAITQHGIWQDNSVAATTVIMDAIIGYVNGCIDHLMI